MSGLIIIEESASDVQGKSLVWYERAWHYASFLDELSACAAPINRPLAQWILDGKADGQFCEMLPVDRLKPHDKRLFADAVTAVLKNRFEGEFDRSAEEYAQTTCSIALLKALLSNRVEVDEENSQRVVWELDTSTHIAPVWCVTAALECIAAFLVPVNASFGTRMLSVAQYLPSAMEMIRAFEGADMKYFQAACEQSAQWILGRKVASKRSMAIATEISLQIGVFRGIYYAQSLDVFLKPR